MSESTDIHAESDALHAEVQVFIDRPNPDGFDALALRIARFQRDHVRPIERLYQRRGISLADARNTDAICAVPSDVFRLARVSVHPPALDTRVFHTSGTSQGTAARGEHPFRRTDTYKKAALAWGKRMLFPDRTQMRVLVLAPSPAEAPHSSLSFMLGAFVAELGHTGTWALLNDRLDHGLIEGFCEDARQAGAPALVLGTSFAYVHLLDARACADAASLRLPTDSRVMQTGGFKGKSRSVEAGELRSAIARMFGAAESHVIGEYGMTELSSQAYEGGLAEFFGDDTVHGQVKPGVYFAPPWMRVTAADPVSLAPLSPGEIGIARIIDLANVDSAVAIQTSDLVRCDGHGFELLGRAPGAAPRGCSIAADAMLSPEGS